MQDWTRVIPLPETMMNETDRGLTGDAPPLPAGEVLRKAREAHGLTIADIAARTRVPQRHLEAIEAGDYSGLPSSTYAVGFAKAYARAVGADEVAIAAAVRAEVSQAGRRPPRHEPFVVADPSRVPSRGVAIAGLGVALAILILIGLWYATDWFRPGATGSGVAAPVAAAPAAVAPAPSPVPSATGQVTLAATDEVWLRVYDADGKTLYLGTMKPGDRFDVPANANDPMINVGRPDKLTVTLNGATLPALGTGERAIKDVRVSAAALTARGTAAPAPEASATPSTGRTRRAGDRPPPRRSGDDEVRRANLRSAANARRSTQR